MERAKLQDEMTKISLNIEKTAHERLVEASRRDDLNVSQAIRRLVQRYLDGYVVLR